MPEAEQAPGLRLLAKDADDLAVISACLQDALVLVGDIAYAGEERKFVLIANRFRWENGLAPERGEVGHERTFSGLAFETVVAVSYRGFRRSETERLLSLLAIRCDVLPTGAVILLEFSGGASVRLEAQRIECRLRDMGDPWPTAWRPHHVTEAAR